MHHAKEMQSCSPFIHSAVCLLCFPPPDSANHDHHLLAFYSCSFIAILFLKSFLFQLLFYLYEKGIELNNIGGFFFQLTERHASYCVLTWLV